MALEKHAPRRKEAGLTGIFAGRVQTAAVRLALFAAFGVCSYGHAADAADSAHQAGNAAATRWAGAGGRFAGELAVAQTRSSRWKFALPRDATTSAGVYDLAGRLVRTLWRAERLGAGSHLATWDQLDDGGRPVAAGNYEFRLLHHRLSYVWEGVIGNSSGAFTGAQIHKAFLPPSSITWVGDRAYYAVGYNEAQPGIHGFEQSSPERAIRPLPSTDPFAAYSMIAADAGRLYWANTGGLSRTSFIGAFDLALARPASFADGRAVCLNMQPNGARCYPDQQYASVIDMATDALQAPTGLAVQRAGPLLAVAHGGQGLIRLYDKSRGGLLREISVPLVPNALNQIAMTPSGDLWVISGKTVVRYTDLERFPRVAATVAALDRPLALATNPAAGEGVWVADGGASHQVKHFERDGTAGVVIGQPGGYATEPRVSPDKLCFRGRDDREQTALAASATGEIWVVDYCNNRMLRFNAKSKQPLQSDLQVAYLPAFYSSTVDHGNPTRVYANFLEFEVDPAAPLVPGHFGRLVRNWLAGLPASLTDERSFNAAFGGLTSVQTLSNGRTYAMLSARGRSVIVELPATGPLRVVKVFASNSPSATAKVLYENGDLGYAMTGAASQSVMRLPLIGFDAQNDPIWSAEPKRLASVPVQSGSPVYRNAFSGILPPRFPVTASGRVIYFDGSVEGNDGFHLGAAASGTNEWLWQASPTGPMDGKGTFQTKAIDRSITYGGNAVWANGRHIVYGYHGEFYKDLQTGRVGQANQFMHFDEDGLFLGQFGMPSTRGSDSSPAGMSGNAFSPTLVRDGSFLYLYHNDESTHGGVHRWRIDGWDDVQQLRLPLTVGDRTGAR